MGFLRRKCFFCREVNEALRLGFLKWLHHNGGFKKKQRCLCG